MIEFKYYLSRQTYRLDGSAGPRKGGAGAQNEREFQAYVEKLRTTTTIAGIDQRRLVLVYHRDDLATGRRTRSLPGSYGWLGPSTSVAPGLVLRTRTARSTRARTRTMLEIPRVTRGVRAARPAARSWARA